MTGPGFRARSEGDPTRIQERSTGRWFVLIGWVDTKSGLVEVVIPEAIALGEPLPLKAEIVKWRECPPVYLPEE